MSGYSLVLKIRKIEEECNQLGFMFCHSRHSRSSGHGDVVALKPKDDDSLPIYARDAELFVGTIDDLEQWIRGVRWARDYDRMLMGRQNDRRRERKEQDYRNQRLLKMIEQGQE